MKKIVDETQMAISIQPVENALMLPVSYGDPTSGSVLYIVRDGAVIAAKNKKTGEFLWGEDALNDWTENAD